MDLLNLRAKISLDRSEYDSGIEGVKSAAKTAGKVLAGAFGLASAAVVAFTKGAVSSFGDYEQLAGGIETLYKDSAGKMLQYADEAFKSAGLSANEYMETAIESSAALINSLGGDTEKAADLMNMSIVDMADNVNKMGTSMESIQNAYRGFSRGNYTMLDNLALGFSGTADGMQQLLDKAEKLSGIKYDIKNYADIVNAIHVVQTEMGISGMTYQEAAEAVRKGEMTWEEATQKLGTTAKEAMTTLQGSFKAAKSAWENVLIALGKGEGVEDALSKLTDSVFVWIRNLMPIIKNALSGIKDVIAGLAPIIGEELPNLISEILPDLLDAGAEILVGLIAGIVDSLPKLVSSFSDVVKVILDALKKSWPKIKAAGVSLLKILGQSLESNLPTILSAGVKIIVSLVSGIIDGLPKLGAIILDIISKIWNALKESWPQIKEAGIQLLVMLAQGMQDGLAWGLGKIVDITVNVWNAIKKYTSKKWAEIKASVSNVMNALKTGVTTAWNNIKTGVQTAVNTLKTNVTTTWNNIKTSVSNTITAISTALNPLKTAISNLKTTWTNAWDNIKDKISAVSSTITSTLDRIKEKFQPLIDKITALIDKFRELGGQKVPHAPSSMPFAGNAVGNATGNASANPIGNSGANIVINVYGTANMSVDELANKVQKKIIEATKRRGAVYA